MEAAQVIRARAERYRRLAWLVSDAGVATAITAFVAELEARAVKLGHPEDALALQKAAE